MLGTLFLLPYARSFIRTRPLFRKLMLAADFQRFLSILYYGLF